MTMRVLSMWQPHASLTCTMDPLRKTIAKKFETRHWSPLEGRWLKVLRATLPMDVVIHATQRDGRSADDRAMHTMLMRCGLATYRPRGAILATAQIVSVEPTETLHEIDEWEELAGDYSYGRFAWRLDKVHPLLIPIPLKGKQEPLWSLSEDTVNFIRARQKLENTQPLGQ